MTQNIIKNQQFGSDQASGTQEDAQLAVTADAEAGEATRPPNSLHPLVFRVAAIFFISSSCTIFSFLGATIALNAHIPQDQRIHDLFNNNANDFAEQLGFTLSDDENARYQVIMMVGADGRELRERAEAMSGGTVLPYSLPGYTGFMVLGSDADLIGQDTITFYMPVEGLEEAAETINALQGENLKTIRVILPYEDIHLENTIELRDLTSQLLITTTPPDGQALLGADPITIYPPEGSTVAFRGDQSLTLGRSGTLNITGRVNVDDEHIVILTVEQSAALTDIIDEEQGKGQDSTQEAAINGGG